MRAIELITEEIPPLTHTDTGENALRWMDELKVSHLPVLKNGNFVGVLSEADVLDKMHLDEKLDKLFDHLPRPYVFANAHIYEVLAKISEHRVSVLPVLDENEKYLGCTSVYHLLTVIANTGSIRESGGILVVEMNAVDYSMAQIGQIVESNNAKILSLSVVPASEGNLEMHIKIDLPDLNPILQSLERFNYNVLSKFQASQFDDELKDRYNELMRYLNM
jgi:CBS domain-containing protein